MAENWENQKVRQIVADFCQEVANEPLCFFSEADLQSMLYARLMEKFPDWVETGVNRGPESKGLFRTPRVHREYGAGEGRRMDIAILDSKELAVANRNLTNEGKYFKPLFGFELGTEKTTDAPSHMKQDTDKLQSCQIEGYLLHFLRDTTESPKNTGRRFKTEAKIDAQFRGPVMTSYDKIACPPVQALFFVVGVAHSEGRLWGRCRFFTKGEWQAVNMNSVGAEVLAHMQRSPSA